ncbi:MAG TPA: sigma-70 family RNA polymerase sigma factor [Terracidiphilus sp.]|jgi:RNA polymerase sigma-70 factor (ECF subfamily)|nr:sigma-70 family RNA polymerase sigma factor [Terracidiphilus sp.]
MRSQSQLRVEGHSAESDDRRLVAQVLAKDRKATAEFVALCADCVYPFVRRRVMSQAGFVEDLVQEILLAAWQNLSAFRGDGDLRGWILGIGRHKVQDHYRKRIRDAELDEQEECVAESVLPPMIGDQLDSEAQRQKVDAVLAALPEAYVLALLWRYRDGRSTREMAQLTGKTEKAIERLLARARESFKRRWLNVRG